MKWQKIAKRYDPEHKLKNWRPSRSHPAVVPLELKHWEVMGDLTKAEPRAGTICLARQGTRKGNYSTKKKKPKKFKHRRRGPDVRVKYK